MSTPLTNGQRSDLSITSAPKYSNSQTFQPLFICRLLVTSTLKKTAEDPGHAHSELLFSPLPSPSTVLITWPTSKVTSESMCAFLAKSSITHDNSGNSSPFKDTTEAPSSPNRQEAPPSPVSPPRSAPRQIYFPPLPAAPTFYSNPPYPTYTAGPFTATSHIHDYGRTVSYMEDSGGYQSAPMRYEGFGDRARLPSQQRSLSLSPTFTHASIHPSHGQEGDHGVVGPRVPAPLNLEQVRRIPALSASPASAGIHPSAADGALVSPGLQYAEQQSSMDGMSGDEPPNSAASFTSVGSVDSDATAVGDNGTSPFISKLQHLLSASISFSRHGKADDVHRLRQVPTLHPLEQRRRRLHSQPQCVSSSSPVNLHRSVRTANQHFAQEVLPMLFRHSNTSSFIRQLNMYAFTRLRAFV